MKQPMLSPLPGTWVSLADQPKRFGRVKALSADSSAQVQVEWLRPPAREWVQIGRLRCGFQIGMYVQHEPRARTRRSLGEGYVVETRTLGGRDQVLVEFAPSGQRLWLPYENLIQILGTEHRFQTPKPRGAGEAERFRLRNLAHALELWNENTGSLSHLEIDPLPHQIHLVHHILASGNLNWLIADDVGLGKTIEVGMLLAALRQRGWLRRVLLVTPAGLTRQWQEELTNKFGMDQFEIYGRDFNINNTRQWRQHDFVIGSIDRLKMGQHREVLLQAEPWDMVVFDEAHRLSRRQYGMKVDASERFALAADLRAHADAFLLLSATPHQGMSDKFQALLELLRPELRREIDMLDLQPEILRDMVIRNHKADVTDADGKFIFKGKTTHAVKVPLDEEARAFDKALQTYLRRGYLAGEQLGRTGNAIGFVMTIYRKLAASSAAAILRALERRRERLRSKIRTMGAVADEDIDERFEGEWEESNTEGTEREFFEGELELLNELIAKAERLLATDKKIIAFQDLLTPVLANNSAEKVLVFTEYRATQDYIAGTLRERFGEDSVVLIHGGMDHDGRRMAIARFEDSAQFLISTEAGGEGINLQWRCHIMVNFDLPWNPMRLVQRIGRLYRYGQQRSVVVFNVHAPQTLDAKIMDLMYQRIGQVVHDMAVLGGEFKAGLEDDILGEVADLLDVEEILQKATEAGIERTQARIEEALRRAREATQKQRDLFEHVSAYNPAETRNELRLSPDHLRAFVEGMCGQLGIEIVRRLHRGAVWELSLPEALHAAIPGFASRFQATLDRTWASNRPNIHMLDLNSPLVGLMLQTARSYEFGGLTASCGNLAGHGLLTAILRWQNDQGRRMRQEYTALQVLDDKRVVVNPEAFTQWLLAPAADGTRLPDKTAAKASLELATQATEKRLAEVSNLDLHPENREWIGGAWL